MTLDDSILGDIHFLALARLSLLKRSIDDWYHHQLHQVALKNLLFVF
jgi:hypothetical protein